MDVQELVIVFIALAAAGYLVRGWMASAKRGTCGGCGCGDKRPSDKCPSAEKG